MPKKSKPKQRTNWKQRALHCEEVIGVQNELARVTGEELRQYKIAYKRESDKANLYAASADRRAEHITFLDERLLKLTTRAESAEKRLAEFKRSEYFVSNACVECGSKREEKYMNYVCYSAKCLRACADKLDPIRTHWQRFKSWLTEYGYELLGGAFVLAVLAGLGALLYWNR